MEPQIAAEVTDPAGNRDGLSGSPVGFATDGAHQEVGRDLARKRILGPADLFCPSFAPELIHTEA